MSASRTRRSRNSTSTGACCTAAMVVSLRSLASTLEEVNLDRPAEDVLEDTDHDFSLHDDDPDNMV